MERAKHLDTYPALKTALATLNLEGRSALVTGGGYGIGVSIAASLADRKISHIILAGRTESKLKETAASLSSSYPATNFTYQVADISAKADVERLFAAISKLPVVAFPDILINNAGYLPDTEPFVDADMDEWWRGFTINVLGTALVTQAFLRGRRALPGDGARYAGPAIVVQPNTVGAYAVMPPKLSAYNASKSAEARWSELLTADVPETEARFFSVHPGFVDTALGHKSGVFELFPETKAKLSADFIVWLATEEAAFLNGRFVWVNWDIEELVKEKQEIVEGNKFRTALS